MFFRGSWSQMGVEDTISSLTALVKYCLQNMNSGFFDDPLNCQFYSDYIHQMIHEYSQYIDQEKELKSCCTILMVYLESKLNYYSQMEEQRKKQQVTEGARNLGWESTLKMEVDENIRDPGD